MELTQARTVLRRFSGTMGSHNNIAFEMASATEQENDDVDIEQIQVKPPHHTNGNVTTDTTETTANGIVSLSPSAKDDVPKSDVALELAETKIENEVHYDGDDAILFKETWFSRRVKRIEDSVHGFLNTYSTQIKLVVGLTLLTAYLVYFGMCMKYRHDDEGGTILIVLTLLLFYKIFMFVLRWKGVSFGVPRSFFTYLQSTRGKQFRKVISVLSYVVTVVAIVLYLALEVFPENPTNLQSLCGMVVMILICFIFSAKPSRVNWHPVFWSFALQFAVAFLTLRTKIGYDIFKWLGDLFKTLFDFSDAGSAFVIGPEFAEWGLALSTSGVIIFTNAFIFLMNYWGVIESIVLNLGGFLSFCLETGPVESVVAAANIFIGLAEAPLMIRPYLHSITKSEIHAIMTCGFASISGGVMGLFIKVGAPPNHLLTAAVISAPAALAVAKLVYPETERVHVESQANIKMADTNESNALNAFSEGAVVAVDVICAMWSNMLAFVSMMYLADAVAVWCGERAGHDGLTFGIICSYVLFPLSMAMGVHLDECLKFGELMGIKMFATPFIAYKDLGVMIDNREVFEDYMVTSNETGWYWEGRDVFLEGTNTTLVGGFFTQRSETIATYAMCGLSAFPAIGMTLGALVPLCRQRKGEIIELIVRAFVAGNVACFVTAAIAGVLFTEENLK